MQQKKSILPVITLAIFSFCFLCTEYMFDDMMALVAGSTEVVNAQNLVLGASVAGFVLYAFLHKYFIMFLSRQQTIAECDTSVVSLQEISRNYRK